MDRKRQRFARPGSRVNMMRSPQPGSNLQIAPGPHVASGRFAGRGPGNRFALTPSAMQLEMEAIKREALEEAEMRDFALQARP